MTFDYWFDHQDDIQAALADAADEDGYFETDDLRDHPQILALHPGFARRDKGCLPSLDRWIKKYPRNAGANWLWSHGNNSRYRLLKSA